MGWHRQRLIVVEHEIDGPLEHEFALLREIGHRRIGSDTQRVVGIDEAYVVTAELGSERPGAVAGGRPHLDLHHRPAAERLDAPHQHGWTIEPSVPHITRAPGRSEEHT